MDKPFWRRFMVKKSEVKLKIATVRAFRRV